MHSIARVPDDAHHPDTYVLPDDIALALQGEMEREAHAVEAVERLAAEIRIVAEPIRHWGGGEIPYDGVLAIVAEILCPVGERVAAHPASSNKRRPLPARTRTAIFERDAYRCVTCGTHLDLTIDHIVPVVAGGSDDPDNLQTMCRTHNSEKGARLP